MIDDVPLWAAASSAGLAAGLTWLGHLPGRRKTAEYVRQVRDRAEQAAARSERTAGEADREARSAARREVEDARAEAAAQWSQLQLVMAELEHLVEVRLPAVSQRLRGAPAAVPTGLRRPDVFDGSEVAERTAEVEEALRAVAAAVRRRVEDSARAGVRAAAEAIQASLTRAQRDIDSAFDDEDDLELSARSGGTYARTLARVDHSVTLAGHTVQRLRILTESWPGVQRANCTVAEIVESARGRVRHSSAVEYTYRAQTGEAVVEGLVVEPVIVALTELLDNATSYSGGAAAVHVVRVAAGMRITVEDQGLGMSPHQLHEAEAALSSGETDITGLGDAGRIGFVVIGRLTRTYGLRVGLSPSASGGVRADLLIPAENLAAEGPEDARPAPAAAADQTPATPAPSPAELPMPEPAVRDVPANDPPESPTHTAHGLPRRQPRHAVRREPGPRQEEVADPEAFTEGFARLRGILAAGYGGDGNANEGWTT